jgi:signal transduction histidine kinase
MWHSHRRREKTMSIGDIGWSVSAAAFTLGVVILTIRAVRAHPVPSHAIVTVGASAASLTGTLLVVPLGPLNTVALAGVGGLLVAVIHRARRADQLERDLQWQRDLARLRAEQVTYVSHEIRTPLSLIRASNELLLDRLADTVQARERELLEVVRRNTDAVVSIVQRNLADARAEATLFAPALKSTDIRKLLALTLAELRQISSIPVLMTLGGPPQRLLIDQSLIRQVILNLVGNAVQPGRGASTVLVRLLQSDEGATISISDDGRGMTEEQRRMLFEPFHSDRVSEANMGVGLTISKQIVELHGGRILIDTMVAAGTTVIVTLPSGRDA